MDPIVADHIYQIWPTVLFGAGGAMPQIGGFLGWTAPLTAVALALPLTYMLLMGFMRSIGLRGRSGGGEARGWRRSWNSGFEDGYKSASTVARAYERGDLDLLDDIYSDE